jgi:hypothetical protein
MFRVLPPFGSDSRGVAEIVNGIMNGKTNNTGTVTLATGGASTTTITDARIGADSTILLSPTASMAGIDYYISSVTNGSAVITHTANVASGRTFKYIVVG